MILSPKINAFLLCYIYYAVLEITGIKNIYNFTSSVSVTCFSNFTVVSIKWLNSSSDIVYKTNMIGSQELLLSVANVSRAIHGTNFTCETINLLPNHTMVVSRMSFTLSTEESSKAQNWKNSATNYINFVYLLLLFRVQPSFEFINKVIKR